MLPWRQVGPTMPMLGGENAASAVGKSMRKSGVTIAVSSFSLQAQASAHVLKSAVDRIETSLRSRRRTRVGTHRYQ